MTEDMFEVLETEEPALPASDDRPPWEGAEDAADDLHAHYAALLAEGEALRRESPDFDLAAALDDPVLLRLTAPAIGVPLRDAWAALHRGELEQRAERRGAQEARRQLAKAVSAGALRPREGGGLESAALTRSDYSALSRPEQLALKQRIREAAARGEKIFP